MGITEIAYEFPSKRWFRSGIHSVIKRTAATGSADTIDTYFTHDAASKFTQTSQIRSRTQ